MVDRRIERLGLVLGSRNPRRVHRLPVHVEAAVAVVIRAAQELEVLLIRRIERDGDPWSGHVAFPGGRRSPTDPDLAQTALRETEEETGVAAAVSAVLGPLDEVEPGTLRLPPVVIAPFVVAVPPLTTASPNPAEVEDAVWVSLSALRRRDAISELRIRRDDVDLSFPSLVHGRYVIWGITHRILGQFLEVAARAGL